MAQYTTAKRLALEHEIRAAHVVRDAGRAVQIVAQRARRISLRHMNRLIYSRPIPVRPRSGKPAWKRTGRLRENEKQITRRAGFVLESRIINLMPYAEPRHEMGKPGRRGDGSRGPVTTRRAPWRDAMMEELGAGNFEKLDRFMDEAVLDGRFTGF